jgi:5-methylcytosine-specific restriction endonuclease McrA
MLLERPVTDRALETAQTLETARASVPDRVRRRPMHWPSSSVVEAADPILDFAEWRRVRARVIERDGGQCVRCGSTERLTVHHTSYAAPLDPSTCVTLCARCHGSESGSNQRKWAESAQLGR